MKNLVFLMMAFFALSFTACSDDDDDTLAQRVEGTYVGNIVIEEFGDNGNFQNKTVDLVATGDDVITLSLKDFNFGGMNVGDIVIPGVKLTEFKDEDEGEIWNFVEPAGTAKVTIDLLGTPVEVTVKVLPENSSIDLDAPREIDLYLEVTDVPVAEQILTIKVRFEGKLK